MPHLPISGPGVAELDVAQGAASLNGKHSARDASSQNPCDDSDSGTPAILPRLAEGCEAPESAWKRCWPAAIGRAMARFYYVVRTDTHVLLSDSVDLPSLERARLEASRRVGDLLKTHSEAIWADKEWQMDVTDEVGLILFVICISAMKSAATQSSK